MKKYTIDNPFWGSKQQAMCIGIAEFRLPCNVKIKNEPGRYIITKEFAENYPVHVHTTDTNDGIESKKIPLRIIPVKELIPDEEGNIM